MSVNAQTAHPAILTAGPSKMASVAPSEPVTGPKITRGPSPALGASARYYVDPAGVRGPFGLVGVGRDVETGRAWPERAGVLPA